MNSDTVYETLSSGFSLMSVSDGGIDAGVTVVFAGQKRVLLRVSQTLPLSCTS